MESTFKTTVVVGESPFKGVEVDVVKEDTTIKFDIPPTLIPQKFENHGAFVFDFDKPIMLERIPFFFKMIHNESDHNSTNTTDPN